MDVRKTLVSQAKRYEELNHLLARPETIADRSLFQLYGREHAELEALVQDYHALLALDQQMREAQEIGKDSDLALQELAFEEIAHLTGQKEELLQRIKVALLPKDPMSPKNAIVTIQPGTEGDESARFAQTLWQMYSRYAAGRGWRMEALTSLQDFNQTIGVIKGKGAYGRLKYEQGTHGLQHARVQSSNSGFLSTAKVTILPEIDEEIEIKDTDVLGYAARVPGPAGERAHCHIGITHVPTGITVGYRANESPSRKQQIALCVLKARLWEQKEAERPEKLGAACPSLVQMEKRHALLRTYDEGCDEVIDHRIGSLHLPLANVLGGELDVVIDQIIAIDQAGQCQQFFEILPITPRP